MGAADLITLISEKLAQGSAYMIIAPILIGFLRFKKLEKHIKLLLCYMCVSAVVEMYGLLLVEKGTNNLFLFHISSFVEIIFLLFVYFRESETFLSKNYLYALLLINTFVALGDAFIWGSLKIFNAYSLTVGSVILIFVSIRYYYLLMKNLNVKRVERSAMFWVNTGVLIYYAGNLFTFAGTKFLSGYLSDFYLMWSLHSIMNIVMLLMFSTAFIWSKKTENIHNEMNVK